ncbi:MAG: histidine--tRNA ligase [bacterium]|nr:histidine--tRNA ligase [bacterium]
MNKLQTLKGFRDFLPAEALKRQYVINKIKDVFERFGFDPLETPALERADVLLGKYGEEADKLLYLFEDNGGRSVGLRYDQTVPLARVLANYPELPLPFKRYQIQPVWRAENTQKGRYREFLQCDIDTVGTLSPLADAEIIECTLSAIQSLGLTDVSIRINDRTIFDTLKLTSKEITILDKLDKIGKKGVLDELQAAGISDGNGLLDALAAAKPTEWLEKIFEVFKTQGLTEGKNIIFDPFLARGLDYYTSTIFEVQSEDTSSSLAGGGRYNDLIGKFSGRNLPAVGIAFGFDRILELLRDRQLLTNVESTTTILITIFSLQTVSASLATATELRKAKINAEMYLDSEAKLDKQLKYADRKGIPYVIIQGPDELARGVVKLKNMQTKEQEELTIEEVIQKLISIRN